MKFNLLKAAFTGLVLIVSITGNASLITKNGYTLNTETNIITDGTLEWLQWDLTVGLTLSEALNLNPVDGFMLATNTQVKNLFNGWGFQNVPANSFGDTEDEAYGTSVISPSLTYQDFVFIFGVTEDGSFGDNQNQTSEALYGIDSDADNLINLAEVRWRIDPTSLNSVRQIARLSGDEYTKGGFYDNKGWALVRNANTSSQVPEPSTLAIFALGVIGLALRRFKK